MTNGYSITVNRAIYSGVVYDWDLDIQTAESNLQNSKPTADDLCIVRKLMREGREILFDGQSQLAIDDRLQERLYSGFARLNELERSIIAETMQR